MALAIVYSRASSGINAPLVIVEAHISRGMTGLNIVGLPEAAVRESKHRVRSAILNTHFKFPSKRITINLAPADLPKEGGRFDLPIALGILAASGQIPSKQLGDYEFTGELALSGELRPIQGVLPVVLGSQHTGRQLIVPHQNASEAALVKKANVLSAKHILEVCAYLKNETQLSRCVQDLEPLIKNQPDIHDVKGQRHAKRALQIAAAGCHSLLFVGPPGTGKTMLATRLPSILPALTEEQALEVAAISSISSQGFDPRLWQCIPFRSPHHSSSSIALVGGGRPPKPGEISLAHCGVLFLDELPEFSRHVLDCLREPLESGVITISRAAFQSIFPARFQLIAAMNPCPCGYAGSTQDECECNPDQIKRYVTKISGPLLDRIDMQVEVGPVPAEILSTSEINEESSGELKLRIIKAREKQWQRQQKCNNALTTSEMETHCPITKDAAHLLQQMMIKFNLSARAYHRIIKVARTIADLDENETIEKKTISEALTYRYFDRVKKLN